MDGSDAHPDWDLRTQSSYLSTAGLFEPILAFFRLGMGVYFYFGLPIGSRINESNTHLK